MTYLCSICGGWHEFYGRGYCSYTSHLLRAAHNHAAAKEQTIIDEWNAVTVPSVPTLTPVEVDPGTSALLILDMENSICQSERCLSTIPKINQLLARARETGMPVVYSLILAGNPA